MKIPALIAAAALVAGAAHAQAPNDSAKAPADTAARTSASAEAKPTQKAGKKKAKKTKASTMPSTQSMGAGPAMPGTDLESADRRARMDEAYANWKAGGAR